MKSGDLAPTDADLAASRSARGLSKADFGLRSSRAAFNRTPSKLETVLILPRRWTWFGHPSLAPVSQQLPYKSCVAHAACRMVETNYRQHAVTVDLDANEVHQCVFGYDCSLAADRASDVLVAMMEEGAPRRSGFIAGQPCPPLTDLVRVPAMVQVETVEDIKRHLVSQGPVIAVLTLTESFQRLPAPFLYDDATASGTRFGHATLLIGYDDDDGLGTWTCQNSYGAGWGDHGCFRLRYGGAMLLNDPAHPVFKLA